MRSPPEASRASRRASIFAVSPAWIEIFVSNVR